MIYKLRTVLLAICCHTTLLYGQTTDPSLTYHVETGATAGGGNYAPLWFTANRNGLSSIEPNSIYLKTELTFSKKLNHHWDIRTGLDLATAANNTSAFIIQQAYADISWQCLTMSIGSKERDPFGKNPQLSSGGMVEGNNTRPPGKSGDRGVHQYSFYQCLVEGERAHRLRTFYRRPLAT